jgi:hypothetical protein
MQFNIAILTKSPATMVEESKGPKKVKPEEFI